jgi:hypothetical protein
MGEPYHHVIAAIEPTPHVSLFVAFFDDLLTRNGDIVTGYGQDLAWASSQVGHQ